MSLMLHRTGLLRPSLAPPAPVAPDAFEPAHWSIASGDEKADVAINSLPSNGGATITDIEFRLDGGSWASSGGTSSFTILSLANAQEYDVQLRAVNSVGAGAAGDTKQVAPEAESEDSHPLAALTHIRAVWDITVLSSLFQERTDGGSTPAGVGDVVGTIRDLTGNGYHLVAESDAARAVLRFSGGLYYIECNGSGNGYATASAINVGTTGAFGGAWTKTSAYTVYSPTLGLFAGWNNPGTLFIGTVGGTHQWIVHADGNGNPLVNMGGGPENGETYVEDLLKIGTSVNLLHNFDVWDQNQNGTMPNNSLNAPFVVGTNGNGPLFYGAHVCAGYETGERLTARTHWGSRSGVTI